MSPGRLSEVARHVVEPEGIVSTAWPSVRNTCAKLGITFDPWQDGFGRLILAKRSDGLYAADTVVASLVRQVGKTYLMGWVIFALCIIHPGLTVLWTAHRFKTASETFKSMRSMAGRKVLAAHIDRVVNGAGDESIVFANGSRVLFGSRERGFGRGFADVDVLVMDEAQILSENAMDDMVPATNQAPNPLILLFGTPPKPTDPGEVFTMLRQEALDGESDGTLYVELSADRASDLSDREQWRKANPSYPHRTPERAMLRMRKNLSETSFVREALGIWDELLIQRAVVKASHWATLVDIGPEDGTRPSALAVDASHTGEFSIAACWTGFAFDGDWAGIHAEEVWAGADADAAAEWVVEHTRRKTPVVIDAMSPAAALVSTLRARRVNVVVTSATDMAKACGLWLSDVQSGRLTHADQESVNTALEAARKRAIGGAGGWGWNRKDGQTNISPLVAHTLARHGASLTKPPEQTTGRRVVVMT